MRFLGHAAALALVVAAAQAATPRSPHGVATVIQQQSSLSGRILTLSGVLESGRHGAALLDCPSGDQGIEIILPAEPRKSGAERLAKLIYSPWIRPREKPVWITVSGRFEFKRDGLPARTLEVLEVREIVEGGTPSWSVCPQAGG